MLKAVASLATVLAVILYPLAMYFGLSHWGIGKVSGLLAVTAILSFGLRWLSWRHHFVGQLLLPATLVLSCSALGWFVKDPRFLLCLPTLINAALFVSFGQSLWTAMPLVERFARLSHADLGAAEVRYCRQVTKLWCGFFVFNGATAAALAWAAPLAWWATYTGLLAYLLMGLLMAGEYVVRKQRFGRWNSSLPDRFLATLLAAPRGQR